MTQDAIVTKLLPDNMAEVLVMRTTACGSNCGSCESCIYQSELKTVARNRIDAKPGQKVLIESKTSLVFNAAMLVYVMPLVLFLIGYALAWALGGSEGTCILVSFMALVISGVILVLTQRARKGESRITFDIIE